jgi:hypothetical protein
VGEEEGIDVATADEGDGFLAFEVGFVVEEGGNGGGAGAFGDGFFFFEEVEDGAGDFFLFDGDDLVDILFNHGEGFDAGAADGDAVGDGGGGGDLDGGVVFEGGEHGGDAGSLDANDFDLGIGFLEGAGDAADEATAADGNEDGFDEGVLAEDFETDSALAGDDSGIVEGVNEGEAFGGGAAFGLGEGLIKALAEEDDLAAEVFGGVDFRDGGMLGHVDDGADAEAGSVVGEALAVVAGRGADDAAGALFGRQEEELIEGAALLEATGHVEVFELEVDGVAGEGGEGFGELAGGDGDGGADALVGSFDVLVLDHALIVIRAGSAKIEPCELLGCY